jgi:5-methylcytosine-specific restriction endonuclease McrBC regulatory subunit McrC
MKLSKAIIKNHGGVDQKPLSSNNSFSYLIDVATLWEDYITSLLRKHLKDFSVEAPNQSSTSYPLLSNGKREIRPDNLIKDKRSRDVVAVIDAKYKMEREIGSTEKSGISREDLHQMITYLHHCGQNTPGLIGVFVTPTKNLSQSDQPELEPLSSSGHKVGVVNCNLQQFDQYDPVPKEDIKEEEKSFADKVRKCLENS